MMGTLIEYLKEGRGETKRGLTFLDHSAKPDFISHDEISKEAKRIGSYFRSLGLVKGDRIALILPDNKDFVLSFLGAIHSGIIPVPLYPPMPGGRLEGYLERAVKILSACQARKIVVSNWTSNIVNDLMARVPSLEEAIFSDSIEAWRAPMNGLYKDEYQVDPSDICFIQFTSGSTGDPKGTKITHANLLSNTRSILDVVRVNDLDTEMAVSWLPLYHDMGLMFVTAPVILHSNVVYISPMTFVMRPSIWLETIHRYRGTTTASPNFGLALATKYTRKMVDLDLSSLRYLICGAEPLNPGIIRGFVDTFRLSNLEPSAILPAYGMAEATLCVTLCKSNEPMKCIFVKRKPYEEGGSIKLADKPETDECLEVVSCGRPLPGHELAIIDQEGNLVPEGQVGEIIFRGPSVTSGYFGDPEATANLFKGKWMLTGDLGFLFRGDLFISGRKKDLIIVAGRNYHPQSIEWSVEGISGIRAGNVAAFSLPGRESDKVVVVAEYKEKVTSKHVLSTIISRVAADIGISLNDLILIEKGSLPKTSSGKIQRNKTKDMYCAGKLERIRLDSTSLSG